MAFSNACGGTAWDMRPDGLIEVEGIGVPSFDQGTAQFAELAQTWVNWSSLMQKAAKRYGLPVSWILAIATEETGLWSPDPNDQATKVSYAGARGVMQIMPSTGEMFGATPDSLFDPATNIDTGSALLAELSDKRNGQFPEMAAAYNSGSVCSPGKNHWNLAMADDYAGNVIKWNNSAVMYLRLTPSHVALGLAVGALGLYGAAMVLGYAPMPSLLRRFL